MERKAKKTLLLVGEGADEVAFLSHMKGLFVTRGCGLCVTIKNARGKGAKHVVEWTKRQIANIAYDACAALLDTDQDYDSRVIEYAQKENIQLLISDPCLEAMLLRFLDEKLHNGNKNLKKQFAIFVNGDATNAAHYHPHFSRELLKQRRMVEPTINQLLQLLQQ